MIGEGLLRRFLGQREGTGGGDDRQAFGDALLDALPEPVILLDARRRIAWANEAARKAFAISGFGSDLSRHLRHPELLEAVSAGIDKGVEARFDLTIHGAVEQVYRVFVRPVRGQESGKVMVVLRDATASVLAERMRADFVANVSHELRTPLASLTGFIETLQTTARDDEDARTRFLDIMGNEAGRMGRLINDLLSLSQVEATEHVIPEEPVDLWALLRRVTDTLSIRAADRDMTLALDLPEGPIMVKGDEDQLTEVFQNLIDNAIKYGRKGTAVEIRAEAILRLRATGGPGVAVAVTDHGDGIAPGDIPRLTERFYRIDKARSRAMGGTGLGLAIVKHIVNRHRGRLAIISEVGTGSTFTVTLRAVDGA